MIILKYNPQDLRYIVVTHDNAMKEIYNKKEKRWEKRHEITLLEEHLNKIPSYMFLPSFSGIPRPQVFLNKKKIGSEVIYWCNSGLWKTIYDWCDENGIGHNMLRDDFKYTGFDMTLKEFEKYVSGWGMTLQARDYQIKAAWMILHYRQSLSQLATRAGKTLIAYIVFRTMLEKMDAHNILMIVPNISLVKQGVQDFKDYKEFFLSEEVWAKGEYCEGANLTIGTFQSLVRRCTKRLKGGIPNKHYDPKFFDKYDVVLCDEAHTLNCQSINDILSQPFIKNCKLKFGFSGTLPDEGTIESFGCHSLMGPTIQDITSKELMDEGFITPIKIHQRMVDHSDEEGLLDDYVLCGEYLCSNFMTDEEGSKIERDDQEYTMQYVKKLPTALQVAKQDLSKEDYKDFLIDLCKSKGSNLLLLEQMILHRSKRHFEEICSVIDSIKAKDNNIIVFAHHTEYLKALYKDLQERYPNKKVFMIHAQISSKKRIKIIEEMNSCNDCILVASFKCVGTGLTFKNVNYGIFAQSFKSKIIVGQSLGRGLGLAPNKDVFELYDIVDMYPTKRLYLQGLARMKYYNGCQYDVD